MQILEDGRRSCVLKTNLLLNSCRLSLQHLNKVQLLANIDEEVRQLNHDNNRFLLSDTNALLHQLVKDGDSSFVIRKDRNQHPQCHDRRVSDTSRMQWGNFNCILLEGVHKEQTA